MTPANTSIKIDPALKKESQALFESFGLSLSAAINMFLRQAVREQAIPFRVGSPLPKCEPLHAMENARQDIGASREGPSSAELTYRLNSDD